MQAGVATISALEELSVDMKQSMLGWMAGIIRTDQVITLKNISTDIT